MTSMTTCMLYGETYIYIYIYIYIYMYLNDGMYIITVLQSRYVHMYWSEFIYKHILFCKYFADSSV